MLMTERDRLIRSYVLVGDIGRALQLKQRGGNSGQQEDHSKYAGAGQSVCTAVEKLCHGS
jgi:hypothetical protein